MQFQLLVDVWADKIEQMQSAMDELGDLRSE